VGKLDPATLAQQGTFTSGERLHGISGEFRGRFSAAPAIAAPGAPMPPYGKQWGAIMSFG
jgi:hypothetical protein